MSEQIEPGDLIRWGDETVSVALLPRAADPWTLIAKGPGWTRHDGSSVNPVPGAECQVCSTGLPGKSSLPSGCWDWSAVQFYRVTHAVIPSQEELAAGRVVERFDPAPSQPPAPQPGKGWIVNSVSLKIVDQFPDYWLIEFGDGTTDEISKKALAGLPWSPPPPPPWEPEVGKEACWLGDLVIVRGIFEGRAWVEDSDGDLVTIPLSKLSPPKGGA